MDPSVLSRLAANDPTLTDLLLNGTDATSFYWGNQMPGQRQIEPEQLIALSHVLESNNTLTSLNLQGNNIGLEGSIAIGRALEKNTTLTQLHLKINPIGNNGIIALSRALEKNRTLLTLQLEHTKLRGAEAGIAMGNALEKNATLTNLDLANYSIKARTRGKPSVANT
jgi:Ran GTPase-activating protein (RanGAP) involved in mRNA processing and transport